MKKQTKNKICLKNIFRRKEIYGLTLKITNIEDWLIGNPHENVDITCHGKLEKNGIICPITIKIPYRKLAKSIGLPFEYNADLETDALSREMIGKKYNLKIFEE